MKWGGKVGAGHVPLGIPSQCHWIFLIIRNTNIYASGVGIEQFLRYKAFYAPQLVSLDASYHKEHEYIWFRGRDVNGFSVIRGWGGGEDLLIGRRIQCR